MTQPRRNLIEAHEAGALLCVRAQPGGRRTLVKGIARGALAVVVAAPPEKGRANEAIIELLSEVLSVRRRQIELVSGPTSRDKRFLVRGQSPSELAERLAPWLAGPALGDRPTRGTV